MIRTLVPIRIMVRFDHEKDAITMRSSPKRLIVGGRARLVRLASSHHAAIRGRTVCSPRANSIVRLWIRS